MPTTTTDPDTAEAIVRALADERPQSTIDDEYGVTEFCAVCGMAEECEPSCPVGRAIAWTATHPEPRR